MNTIKQRILVGRGAKRYKREITVKRTFTDRFIYDVWEASGVERPFLDYFLRRTVTITPCWEADKVKKYLSRIGPVSVGNEAYIRLDDREFETNSSRLYPECLTAEQLHHHLRRPRFNAEDLPDAHRRLVAVLNLNASTITTLAQTALFHQVDPLNDAFWKHINSETSLTVHEPLDGFVTPRLEFHMPYLTLRRGVGDFLYGSELWEDISFLRGQASGSNRHLIYVAHISIVLCIWDYTTWTGYSFSRPCPLDTEELLGPDDDVVSEADSDSEADQEYEEVPKEDIFAPGSGDHDMNDEPIWDPRMYFLHVVAIWMNSITQEYTFLVRSLEELVTVRVPT
jgi:hypothetical protein